MQIPNKPFLYRNRDGKHLLKLTKGIQSNERCQICFFAKYLEGDYCNAYQDSVNEERDMGNCGDDNHILYYFQLIKSKPIKN